MIKPVCPRECEGSGAGSSANKNHMNNKKTKIALRPDGIPALPEYADARIVELRRVTAEDLNPLLEEEAAVWRAALDWDFVARLRRRWPVAAAIALTTAGATGTQTRKTAMKALVSKFIKNESGATAIEYGLIAALIAVAAIVAMQNMGKNLQNTFNTASTKLDCAKTTSC